MLHLEVLWVSMQGRSLMLQIEKLRPRESTRFAQVTEQSWDTAEDLKAESGLTPNTFSPNPLLQRGTV